MTRKRYRTYEGKDTEFILLSPLEVEVEVGLVHHQQPQCLSAEKLDDVILTHIGRGGLGERRKKEKEKKEKKEKGKMKKRKKKKGNKTEEKKGKKKIRE